MNMRVCAGLIRRQARPSSEVRIKQVKRKGRCSASVTVFLSIAFVCIAALLLGIAESARTYGARFYLQVAADAAMESLFSQYHRRLWADYHVLGLEYRDDVQLRDEFHAFMQPYLESKDWYPSKLDKDNIHFSEFVGLTEDVSFEEEMLAYMKYGMLNSLIRFCGEGQEDAALSETLTDLFQRTDESEALRKIQSSYQLGARDVAAVEKAIAELASRAETAQAQHTEAGDALQREWDTGFYKRAESFQKDLQAIKRAVPDYTEAADRLGEKVAELRMRFEQEKAELSPEAVQAVEAELSEYEAYVSEKGAVRAQIEAMPAQADRLIGQTSDMVEEVRDFERWISDLIADQDDDDDYDYSAEIREFYRSMYAQWSAMNLIRYGGEVSRVDSEVQNALDQVAELMKPEMLRLVLPEGVELPERTDIHVSQPNFFADTQANPLELVMLGEYAFRHFSYYQEKAETPKAPPSGCKDYEVEYLICGKDSNYDNLSDIVVRLVTLREAMNLIYLFTDQQKRNEAKLFVTQLLCLTANPVLITVLSFFVLSVWALGQAICDVRNLLDDARVPLFHTKGSWSLDLDGLLALGRSGSAQGKGEQKLEKGLSYQDYLRVFLYGAGLADQKQINRRMLACIQQNISGLGDEAETGFQLSNCLYAAGIELHADARHVMSGVGIVQMVTDRRLQRDYSVSVQTYHKYRSETH